MQLTAAVGTLAALVAFANPNCNLPQNDSGDDAGGGGGAADARADDAGSTAPSDRRTWRVLRIVDDTRSIGSARPGTDVDAVMAFRPNAETGAGERFLFAGCETAELVAPQRRGTGAGQPTDPAGASLGVRENAPDRGFVSLAGGTLRCVLPVPVRTGDRITVWEMTADGAEQWRATVAPQPGASTVNVEGTFQGSAGFRLP